jgi:hypothetical protein
MQVQLQLGKKCLQFDFMRCQSTERILKVLIVPEPITLRSRIRAMNSIYRMNRKQFWHTLLISTNFKLTVTSISSKVMLKSEKKNFTYTITNASKKHPILKGLRTEKRMRVMRVAFLSKILI